MACGARAKIVEKGILVLLEARLNRSEEWNTCNPIKTVPCHSGVALAGIDRGNERKTVRLLSGYVVPSRYCLEEQGIREVKPDAVTPLARLALIHETIE